MDQSDLPLQPRLRAVEIFPVPVDGRELFCLKDPQGFAERPLFLNRTLVFIVSRMDGSNTLRDIQADIFRATGEIIPMEDLEGLKRQLDENRYLDSPAFRQFYEAQVREFLDAPTRAARHSGSVYEAASPALISQLESYYSHPDGPGKPIPAEAPTPLRGLISPHIDYHRGGPTYAHAYRALAEHLGADRFIVFGTCHNPMERRFAFTSKDYETPLGTVQTDRQFVARLASRVSTDYFADEFAHRAEHSIELQTVWLKHVLGEPSDFKIIPILVGSFHDLCSGRRSPAEDLQIGEVADALTETMEQIPGRYCIVAGADLAHVGRRFGDPSGPTESFLKSVAEEDRFLLERAAACDAEGVFKSVAADNDRRRVCGYPPIYMTLKCLDGARGSLLQYRQWADLDAAAAVTYAAVAFY